MRATRGLLPAARLTALAQAPREGAACKYFRQCFDEEHGPLTDRYMAATHTSTIRALRSSFDAADPLSVRSLQRRLVAQIDLDNARDLQCCLAYHWLCNLPHDSLESKLDQRGMGGWLQSLPTSTFLELTDDQWLWAMQSRLGLQVAGTSGRCSRLLPNGRPCGAALDTCGIHPCSCLRSLAVKRHNLIRDLIAQLAKVANCTVQVEQRILTGLETRPRCIHTADLCLIDSTGRFIYVDVRTTAKPLDKDMRGHLLQHERDKRAEYGATRDFCASSVFDGIRPCVFDAWGRAGPAAISLLEHLYCLAMDEHEKRFLCSRSVAYHRMVVPFTQRLSCALVRMRHKMAVSCSHVLPMTPCIGPVHDSSSQEAPLPPLQDLHASDLEHALAAFMDERWAEAEPAVDASLTDAG